MEVYFPGGERVTFDASPDRLTIRDTANEFEYEYENELRYPQETVDYAGFEVANVVHVNAENNGQVFDLSTEPELAGFGQDTKPEFVRNGPTNVEDFNGFDQPEFVRNGPANGEDFNGFDQPEFVRNGPANVEDLPTEPEFVRNGPTNVENFNGFDQDAKPEFVRNGPTNVEDFKSEKRDTAEQQEAQTNDDDDDFAQKTDPRLAGIKVYFPDDNGGFVHTFEVQESGEVTQDYVRVGFTHDEQWHRLIAACGVYTLLMCIVFPCFLVTGRATVVRYRKWKYPPRPLDFDDGELPLV